MKTYIREFLTLVSSIIAHLNHCDQYYFTADNQVERSLYIIKSIIIEKCSHFASLTSYYNVNLHVTHKHYNFRDLSNSVDIGDDPAIFIGQAVKKIIGILRHQNF